MRSYLRVVIAAGLVAALVFGALSLVPPRYAATAQLSVAQPIAADVQPSAAAAMADALRSRDLARKLMAELARANDGELVPNDLLGIILQAGGLVHRRPGETAPDRELAAYYRSLRVAQSDGAVTVEFTSTTPELSARAANRLAELYLASTASKAEPSTRAADQGRAAEIERLTREVAEADAAVARARAEPDASSEPQRLGDLAEATTQAQSERSDAERRARAVREMLGKGSVESIPDIHPSPELHELIAERVRVEVQKTVAERTLPADHPRVRELQAKLSELRWRMFREATTIAKALDVEVQAAAQREAEARARLDRARTGTGDSSGAHARLASLEQDAAAKRTALEALQAQQHATRHGTDAASQSAARLTRAQPSAGPLFPRKGPLALLTAVSTLMLGFIFVIARQLVNGARRTQSGNEFVDLIATARDRADVRLEGPQADGGDARLPEVLPAEASAEPGHFAIVSSPDDAARHIAGSAAGRSGYRALLVGDGIDGAGEARDLASALAIPGRRSVLVDWCPEGRGIATALGLPNQPGINDLIAGRATFDDVIMRLPGSDAHFIACGAPAVQKMLDADWVNMILDALDEAYDHITVAARMEPARTLFQAIEGRFDAGIVMSERGRQGGNINAAPGVFLGFEVTEICIVQMDLAQRRTTVPRRARRSQRPAMV